jgi:predicted LPLAT superfamily acyltransferase
MQDKFRFEFTGYGEFLKILDSGPGVVMIGAHVGSWEAGSQFFGDYARRMNIVLYDAEYKKIKEALERNFPGAGFKVIAVNDDGLENIVRIKRALDSGEYVCFQGDRYVSSAHTFEAEFLGHCAKFPAGPFTIGARMRVPVVFYYAMREQGRRYKFHFVEAKVVSGVRRPERLLLEEYVAATEKIVRAYPGQWFNFYKFWE